MNEAQQRAARRIAEHFRSLDSWPHRKNTGPEHAGPKRCGVHDASLTGDRLARVLFMVDGRRVALAMLDEDGEIVVAEVEAAFRAHGARNAH